MRTDVLLAMAMGHDHVMQNNDAICDTRTLRPTVAIKKQSHICTQAESDIAEKVLTCRKRTVGAYEVTKKPDCKNRFRS